MPTNTNEAELLPCPFCGDKPFGPTDEHIVYCINALCQFSNYGIDINQWNTRTPYPQPNIEALAKEIDNYTNDLNKALKPLKDECESEFASQWWVAGRNSAKTAILSRHLSTPPNPRPTEAEVAWIVQKCISLCCRLNAESTDCYIPSSKEFKQAINEALALREKGKV